MYAPVSNSLALTQLLPYTDATSSSSGIDAHLHGKGRVLVSTVGLITSPNTSVETMGVAGGGGGGVEEISCSASAIVCGCGWDGVMVCE